MLTVAVLGGVVVRRDGALLSVPSGKVTELLVRLALDAGRTVRSDRLIEDLWSDVAGRNTLQSKVSQLRRALGDPDLVVNSGDGYALALPEESVDANRVLDLAATSSAALAAGDARSAVTAAEQGVACFRGEVLAGSGDWAMPYRARLEETRLSLIEDLFEARLSLGSGAEVVAELELLVRQHPVRERLWASLMTALYRAGRQVDALAAYARVRGFLVDELGIDPGPALQDLERDVLRQSPDLSVAMVLPAAGVGAGNLPPRLSRMIGRAADLVSISKTLAPGRLVTVVGPAGIGKTACAVEAARSCGLTGGAWLVRLDAIESGVPLTAFVAGTLHVSSADQLIDRLVGAHTLVVLDNCEHVVDDVAAWVRDMLLAAPRLRLLATSQVPLGVEGEIVHRLAPLSEAQSTQLFAERAGQTRRGFTMDEPTTVAVTDLCSRLDGLPLAIELAAARVRSMSVHDIARRLDDRFTLLNDPSSRQPIRRRALAGAISWSYDLLFPDDRTGLWALACFAGTASLDATEHVMRALGVPAEAVLDVVTRLVDRSLVTADIEAHGAVRYRLLDSIRAYAVDRLDESGMRAAALSAHADWYALAADACDAAVRGPDQASCLSLVRAERRNIDAALAWAATQDPVLGTRIANGFGWAWVVLGDGVAGAERLRAALSPEAPAAERARCHLLAGWLEASAGDVALADVDLTEALAIADALDDEVLRADAHRHWAFVCIQQGRAQDVREHAASALTTYQRLTMPWEAAGTRLLSAYGALMLGDPATAGAEAGEAVRSLTQLGDSWGLTHGQAMLGAIAAATHRFDDEADALSAAVAASERLGFPGQAALHLTTLARVQQRAGEVGPARSTLTRAIAAATEGGDLRLAATARLHLARMLRGQGDRASARAVLDVVDAWYRAAGGGDGALLARCLLAAETRDRSALESVRSEAQAGRNPEVVVYAQDALARESAKAGDREQALRLLSEADRSAQDAGHVIDELDRADKAEVQRLLAE